MRQVNLHNSLHQNKQNVSLHITSTNTHLLIMLCTTEQWTSTTTGIRLHTQPIRPPTTRQSKTACSESMHMRLCISSPPAAACQQHQQRFGGGPACCGPWPHGSCPQCSCSSQGPQSAGHRHTPSSGSVQPLCTAWLLYACNNSNSDKHVRFCAVFVHSLIALCLLQQQLLS